MYFTLVSDLRLEVFMIEKSRTSVDKRTFKQRAIIMHVARINVRKAAAYLGILSVVLALLSISITVYVLYYRIDKTLDAEIILLPVIALMSLVCCAVSLLLLRPASDLKNRIEQAENSVEDLNSLNNKLRAQRHDFMNHLQVVHSLIELGEHAEAGDYIEKIYTSIEIVNSILKTGFPAVNAILEAKRQACENRGIEVTMDIRTDLADIPIPSWELCRLFSNIIDNAINALSEAQSAKCLGIEIYEDIHSYWFRISNNGPAIPPQIWKRIFDVGFTTHEKSGEGMGLAICHRIVTEYGGVIKVYSDDIETVFEGHVPRSRAARSKS